MTDVLLSIAGVSRSYGSAQALCPVDLAVAAGECVALLGPNGSGKSTLLRIAAGRDEPTTGSVSFDGRPMVEDATAVRAQVAVVGDVAACYPDLTVREHLELVALAHGLGDGAERAVAEALATMRLEDRADALPSALSSGQRQSLLLASAVVRPRRLLVLDEPERHLDPDARGALVPWLLAEKERGVAVLLATHHVEIARAAADRALLLSGGNVDALGDAAEVLTGAFVS